MKITTPNGILEGDSIEAILKKYGTACLLGAYLRYADLRGADLRGANLSELTVAQTSILPDEGDIIGWKKALALDGAPIIGELAKMLRQNGLNIGQNRLFEILRQDGYLGKTGSNRNVPTQKAMDLGLFRIKETAITHSDGHVTINRTAKVTGKGQTYFISRYCPPADDE